MVVTLLIVAFWRSIIGPILDNATSNDLSPQNYVHTQTTGTYRRI